MERIPKDGESVLEEDTEFLPKDPAIRAPIHGWVDGMFLNAWNEKRRVLCRSIRYSCGVVWEGGFRGEWTKVRGRETAASARYLDRGSVSRAYNVIIGVDRKSVGDKGVCVVGLVVLGGEGVTRENGIV